MAQQLLHASQVGAVVQQVRREAVPQRVRADPRIEARRNEVFVELPPDARVLSDSPCLLRNTRPASRLCCSADR